MKIMSMIMLQGMLCMSAYVACSVVFAKASMPSFTIQPEEMENSFRAKSPGMQIPLKPKGSSGGQSFRGRSFFQKKPAVRPEVTKTFSVESQDLPDYLREDLFAVNSAIPVAEGARSGGTALTGEDELIAASNRGDLKRVKKLHKAGTDLFARDLSGKTALVAASERGHVKVVKYLASVGGQQDYDKSLVGAVHGDHLPVVKALLRLHKYDDHAVNTAIDTAVVHDKGHIANYLREHRSRKSEPALHDEHQQRLNLFDSTTQNITRNVSADHSIVSEPGQDSPSKSLPKSFFRRGSYAPLPPLNKRPELPFDFSGSSITDQRSASSDSLASSFAHGL